MQNLKRIVEMATDECIRQEATEVVDVANLLLAYDYALREEQTIPNAVDAMVLAKKIEPLKVAYYRMVQVTFGSGGTAANWMDVPGATERLFDVLDPDTDVDAFVIAFLKIHPFIDGNGRTAWILHNWLSETLSDPHHLPDYFGEAADFG